MELTTFLWTKKLSFEKTTSTNRKTNVSFTEKNAKRPYKRGCQFFDYSKMSFLWTKKPPFDKTTWSNDKIKVSCTEKWAWKIFLTFVENRGLTRFKICKFIDYSKISTLWTKKPPFNKTTWSNDKTKVSCTEK